MDHPTARRREALLNPMEKAGTWGPGLFCCSALCGRLLLLLDRAQPSLGCRRFVAAPANDNGPAEPIPAAWWPLFGQGRRGGFRCCSGCRRLDRAQVCDQSHSGTCPHFADSRHRSSFGLKILRDGHDGPVRRLQPEAVTFPGIDKQFKLSCHLLTSPNRDTWSIETRGPYWTVLGSHRKCKAPLVFWVEAPGRCRIRGTWLPDEVLTCSFGDAK